MKEKLIKNGIIANIGKNIANAIKALATNDDEKTEEMLKDYELQDVERKAVENFKKKYENYGDKKSNKLKEKVEQPILKNKLVNQNVNELKEENERED